MGVLVVGSALDHSSLLEMTQYNIDPVLADARPTGENAKTCDKIPRLQGDMAFIQNNRVLLERRQHEQPYPQRQMIGIARVRVLPQGSVQFDKAHDRSFLKNFTLEKQATNRDPGHSCYARGAASGLSSHPPGQIALNARS